MGTPSTAPTGKRLSNNKEAPQGLGAPAPVPNKDEREDEELASMPPPPKPSAAAAAGAQEGEGRRVVAKPPASKSKKSSMMFNNKAAEAPGAFPVDVALTSSTGGGSPPRTAEEFAGPFGTMVDVDLEDGARNPVLHLVEANLVKDEPSEKILVAATPVEPSTAKPGAVAAAKLANRRLRIVIAILVIVCAAAIGVGLYWGLKPKNTEGTRDRSETDYSDASSNYDSSSSSSSSIGSRSTLLAPSRPPVGVVAAPEGDDPLRAASVTRAPQPKPTPAPTIAPTPAHHDDNDDIGGGAYSLPTPAPTRSYSSYLHVFRRPTYPPAISGAFVPTPTQPPTNRPTSLPTDASSSSSPATRSRSMQLLARSRAPLVMAPPEGNNPLLAASVSRPPQPRPTPAPTIAPTPAPTRSYTSYLYIFRRPTYPPAISGAFVPTPTQPPTNRPTVSPTEYPTFWNLTAAFDDTLVPPSSRTLGPREHPTKTFAPTPTPKCDEPPV